MEREASPAELRLCEKLRDLLSRFESGELPAFDDTALGYLNALEWFIPELLREVHQEWDYESVDGIDPSVFRKTGRRSVEVVGAAILITDQSLVALAVRLQLSPNLDRVSWLNCRLGESDENGNLRRIPYGRNWGIPNVTKRLDSIEWRYHVGYGKFEPTD